MNTLIELDFNALVAFSPFILTFLVVFGLFLYDHIRIVRGTK